MMKSIQYLLAVGAFASAAFAAQAQPALKIATVDMAKLYDGHWKTQDQMNKLKADRTTAQAQYDQMTKDLTAKIQAGKIIAQIARMVGGSGGGRPDMAEAGGKDAGQLDAALRSVPEVVKQLLASGS